MCGTITKNAELPEGRPLFFAYHTFIVIDGEKIKKKSLITVHCNYYTAVKFGEYVKISFSYGGREIIKVRSKMSVGFTAV